MNLPSIMIPFHAPVPLKSLMGKFVRSILESLRIFKVITLIRGGVRVGSVGSIEPMDFETPY